jgi:hypothetical protein
MSTVHTGPASIPAAYGEAVDARLIVDLRHISDVVELLIAAGLLAPSAGELAITLNA